MYCDRIARQATPQECHETIAQTADSALYSTCRACATGQRLMASVQWAKEGGADASPIYNDEETIMTKKTTKTATAPTTETPAQTPATAEAKTYTIKDLCEEIGLPYGTVYAAVRHLSRRGNVATSPSHKKIQGALDALGIRPADIVAERRRKKPEDSPLDELEAAQALGIAVAPALEESKMPDVPAADPAALQPDEGANAVLIRAHLLWLLPRSGMAGQCGNALRARQQLSQIAITREIGHEEIHVHGFAVLAMAQGNRRSAAKPAAVGAQHGSIQ